jgi:hypothetical protein
MLLVGGAVFAAVKMFGKSGGSVAAGPVEFDKKYQNQAFSFVGPSGWDEEDGGVEAHKWVKFTKGSASIKVQLDQGAELYADIMHRDTERNDGETATVARIHAGKIDAIKEEHGDAYSEEEAVAIHPKFGDGRRSAFKVKQMLGDLRGYRVTIQGGVRSVMVICKCPASQWDSLRPGFEKLIDSVGFGVRN